MTNTNISFIIRLLGYKRHILKYSKIIFQVIMGDRASAERACKDPNPIIDGRKANVNLAILGAKPRGNLTPGK